MQSYIRPTAGLLIAIAILFYSPFARPDDMPGSEEKVVVRFARPSPEDARRFLSSAFDVAAYRPGVYLDIVTTPSQYNTWRHLGLDVAISQDSALLTRQLTRKTRQQDEGYRDYGQLLAELRQIEETYPRIAKLYDIGDSWGKVYGSAGNGSYRNDNHDIWAMKLSDEVLEEEDEPAVFFIATHHAREPISLEVAMALLYHLLDSYGTDPQITKYVEQTQIWFVPLLNPDGHRVVVEAESVLWRKNMRDNNHNGQRDIVGRFGGQPDGVDLNRNYGFQWGLTGASDDPNRSTYHGPSPMSEQELMAVRDLFASHHFLAGISYHSYGELVLYPYGYGTGIVAPDMQAIQDVSQTMAGMIPRLEQPGEYYASLPAWEHYPIMGALMDFSYGTHGTFCYAIELGTEFIPPAETIPTIAGDNIDAALVLLNRLNYAILTGRALDSLSGDPIEADIIIEGIDDTMMGIDDRFPDTTAFRRPYSSNPRFGRYYRLLTPGTYNVSFWADGYQTVSRSSVRIQQDSQTLLDIEMDRSGCPDNRTTQADLMEGVSGGSLFVFLKGTNVTAWDISYGGTIVSASKHKEVVRIDGIDRQNTAVTVAAHGYDVDGTACSDSQEYAIDPGDPVCPTITIDDTDALAARTGGSVNIPLSGTDVDTWNVTYNGYTAILPGKQPSYNLSGLTDTDTRVSITARGFDAALSTCQDSIAIDLRFTDAMAQIPDSGGSGGCFISTVTGR